jgi:vacuolar-type H+-ATPase subunit H
MVEDIRSLIEKINQDGIRAAEEKARDIEDAARRRADDIIAAAQQESEDLISAAKERIRREDEIVVYLDKDTTSRAHIRMSNVLFYHVMIFGGPL